MCERYVNDFSGLDPNRVGGATLGHGTPAGLRPSNRRGARDPLHPAVVHRRAGHGQVVQHHAGRTRERPRGGHDVRRVGHRRLLAGPGVRRVGHARRPHVPDPAVASRPGRRPGLLRRAQPRRHALRGRPPSRAAPHARKGAGEGIHLLRGAGARVVLLRERRRVRRGRATAPRPRLVLRVDGRRPCQRDAPAHRADARRDGHPRRVQPARGLAEPARDRPAPHRRAVDGRRGDDHAADREGDRQPVRRPRDLHAEADRGHAGLGHAHALLALRRRHQRVLRRPTTRSAFRRSAGDSSPDSSRTPARSPPSPTNGSTATSGSWRATRRLSTSAGRGTIARRWCGCPRPRTGAPTRRGSSTARPIPRATRISRSRWCSPPACGASRRVTSYR